MKYFFALTVAGFIGVSAYLLMKDRPVIAATQKKIPDMLNRERSGEISIVDFKSDDTGVKYKVSNEQLDEFENQVKILKESRPAGVK